MTTLVRGARWGIAGLLLGVGVLLEIVWVVYPVWVLQYEIVTMSFFNDYPWHRKILLFLWYMTWPYWLSMLLYSLSSALIVGIFWLPAFYIAPRRKTTEASPQ